MIYIYFEDYSQFTFMLDHKKIEHGGRIIKAYAAPFDPSIQLNNGELKIITADDSPLNGEVYSYPDRGVFRGNEIEERIFYLDDFGKSAVRGLMRFSNRDDLQFCQTGMAMKKGRDWLIPHPLEDIDGISTFSAAKVGSAGIHLDIFNAQSLKRLSTIVDIRHGSKELLDPRIGLELKTSIHAEISGSGQERHF